MKEKVRLLLEKLRIHKFKLLGGVLGILVLTGAVFGAYKLGQKQVQPGSQPTPSPTVTCGPCPQFMPPHPDFCKDGTLIPGGEDECGCQGPPRCQSSTADWKTYTNTKYGYEIKYPKEWEIKLPAKGDFQGNGYTIPLEQINILYPNAGTGGISVYYNSPNSSVYFNPKTYQEELAIQAQRDKELDKWELKEIGEKEALLVTRKYWNTVLGDYLRKLQVTLPLGDKYLLFIDQPLGSDLETFDFMLSTFKFLGSEGSSEGKFVCPKGDSIDCMPIVEGEAKWFCSKEYLNWARKNCPKFIITY